MAAFKKRYTSRPDQSPSVTEVLAALGIVFGGLTFLAGLVSLEIGTILFGGIFLGLSVLYFIHPYIVRLAKCLFTQRGFTPFALGLIVIGVIFSIIFFSMDSRGRRDDLVIRSICWWTLIIGVGYFLFKLLLVGISKIAEAAKTGVAKAPPPAQETTPPPADLKTRLRTLEDLHNDGLLTDAEYQAKREEILGEV